MSALNSDERHYICVTTLKKLEETVDGKLRVQHIKHSDGRIFIRYALEYEEFEDGPVSD